MNTSRYSYKFETRRSMNQDEGFIRVDSLDSALKNLSSDGLLRAVYNLQIGDRISLDNQIELPHEFLSELNTKEILDYLDEEVDRRHFGKI